MKKSIFNFRNLIVLIISLSGSYAKAQCTLIHNPASFISTNNFAGPYDYVQSFTAPCSGNMNYFQLTSTSTGTLPGATLNIYNGGVSSGTAIYTQAYPNIVITNVGDPITILITGTVPLVSGNQYSFRFSASTLDFKFESPGSYPGGHIWQDGTALTGTDFVFNVSIGSCTPTSIVADVAQLPTVNAECSVNIATPPTATNSCGTVINGTSSQSFPITAQGSTQITWTYNDGQGNTTSQTQNIVIADVSAPVPDLAQLPDLTNLCQATTLTPPTATDNCAGAITGVTSTTLPITTLGNSTITWSYSDAFGNVSTQTQNVINPTIDNSVTVSGGTIQANQNSAVYQWVDCANAFSPISGETSQAFTATANGSYAVQINVQGCLDTSACEIIDFTGIEELTLGKKEVVKIIDFLGRETEFKLNTPLIFVYSDGTMKRVMQIGD